MKIIWNQYTWYSKLAAVIFFIAIMPTLTFYLGTQYEKTVSALTDAANYAMPVNYHTQSTVVSSASTTTSSDSSGSNIQNVSPKIISLTPSTGGPSMNVTIKGSGFDKSQNLITFGPSYGRHHPDGTADNVVARATSVDGRTLTFSVPATGPQGIICDQTNHCVGISAILLAPGNYPVTVITKVGTSNAATFTLNKSGVGI